jgi:hypothetical protein
MLHQDFRRMILARTLPAEAPRPGSRDIGAEPRATIRTREADDEAPAAED